MTLQWHYTPALTDYSSFANCCSYLHPRKYKLQGWLRDLGTCYRSHAQPVVLSMSSGNDKLLYDIRSTCARFFGGKYKLHYWIQINSGHLVIEWSMQRNIYSKKHQSIRTLFSHPHFAISTTNKKTWLKSLITHWQEIRINVSVRHTLKNHSWIKDRGKTGVKHHINKSFKKNLASSANMK